MPEKGWSRKFDDPIPMTKGKELVTLRDAALYVTKLPKAEQQIEEWQTGSRKPDQGRGGRSRLADVGAHRRHAGVEPSRRAGV
jgi:hypothetical protein